MMIQHIFSDMDGTLLNSKGQISSVNQAAIKKANIPFTLVSARAPLEMTFAIEALQLTNPQIAFNGGLIFQPKTATTPRKVLREIPLSYPLFQKLIQLIPLYFPQVSLSFYDDQQWYTEKVDAGILYEMKITQQVPTLISLKDFSHPELKNSKKIFKIMLITFEPKVLSALKNFLEKLEIPGIALQQSGTSYLEITHEKAKKSAGIQEIITLQNLTKETLAAFGDGHNDLPMLEMVGFPIVMANALPEIKRYGKKITKSNDEDGISFALTHYFN